MKNKLFNIADFYLLLWVSMSIIDIFRVADRLSVIMLGIALIMSVYYDYVIIKSKNLTPFLKALNILVIMFTIYGVIYIVFGERTVVGRLGVTVNNRTYLKNILISLLPIFPFYYFSLKGWLTENGMKWWLIIIFIVSYFVFFARQREVLEEAFLRTGEEIEQATTNASYWILALIPGLVFFKKNKILFYCGLAFCMLFTLWGMKRGAILIGMVCVVVLLYDQIKYSKKSNKVLFLTLSIIFMTIAFNYIMSFYSENDYFQWRFQQTLEGNSSGRNLLYDTFLSFYFNEQSLFQLLFGLGANGTLRVSENYAHNDWLEILINQGAIGFMVYFYYWVELYKAWRKSKINADAYMGITLFVLIFFMKTLFSMSYSSYPYFASMVFAYYLSIIKKNEIIARYQ